MTDYLRHRARLVCVALCCSLLLAGCASSPPSDPDNLCSVFGDNKRWYRAANRSVERWGGSIPVAMSIMYQESTFERKAKPKMRYFLWVIPIGRGSDAYGYSQALKSTWKQYEKDTNSSFKSRTSFADSIDFILWYMNKTYTINGVSKWDAYRQYLNYHEGHGGYARGTFQSKRWLLGAAQTVDARAKRYSAQFAGCKDDLG